MYRVLLLGGRRPLAVIAVLLALTALFALRLPSLHIDVSPRSLLAREDPERRFQDRVAATFGSAEHVVVVFHDPALPDPGRLTAIEPVVKALSSLPFVESADSLFTHPEGSNVNDEIRFRPYFDPLPKTLAAARAVLARALRDPFVVGNLASRDGHTLALDLRLRPGGGGTTEPQIAAAVEKLIAPLRGRLARVFALGSPEVGEVLSQHIVSDQERLLPLALVVLLGVLWLSLGRFQAALVPLVTGLLSVVWTLGLMAWWHIPLHVLTSMVPALLLIVGSTEDVHLLAAYYAARGEGEDRGGALARMARDNGLAVLLTFLTTYLGFLSIALSDVSYLRDFGLVASTGLFLNFAITVLLVPAILRLLPDAAGGGLDPRREALFLDFANWSFRRFAGRPGPVLATAAALGLGAAWAATGLRVSSDTLGYLPRDAAIHEQVAFLHRELSGVGNLELVLDSRIQGTFLKVRYLRQVARLQAFLAKDPRFDASYSLADYAMLVDRLMDGSPGDPLALPDDDAVLQEYLGLTRQKAVNALADRSYSKVRILVRHGLSESGAVLAAVRDIRAFAAKHLDPALRLRVTGDAWISAVAADSMAKGQAESLLLMVGVIFLLVAGLFLELKAGLLALVPNLLPVLLMFAAMALAGIPLSTATAMVAAIAIGISIDDTMHFLVRYNQEMKVSPSHRLAVLTTLEEEARPMLSTSVALAAGFLVLGFSSFPPVVHFGLLSALVMLLALGANLILAPVLLVFVRLSTAWDLMGVDLRQHLVRECPLFEGLSGLQLRRFMAFSRHQELGPGSTVIGPGGGRDLCLVLDGEVTLGDGDAARRAGMGELFGEAALNPSGSARGGERAVTVTPVTLLRISAEELARMHRTQPRMAAKVGLNLARMLAGRVRDRASDPGAGDG